MTAAPPAVPRWAWAVVACLALALCGLPAPPEPGLDPSYWQVLVWSHGAGLRFGPEVAYTYGPLGFLCSPFASDGVPAPTLVWRTLGALALAATFVAAALPLPPVRRGLLWAALVALCGHEQALVLVGPLAVLAWLLPPRSASPWLVAAATLWLASLAHVKLTLLLQAACGVAVAGLTLCLRGERRRALSLVVGFVALYVVFWWTAGQSLSDLPIYLRHGWHISAGYDRAMGLNHTRAAVWAVGQAVLVALTVWGVCALRGPERRTRAPVVAYAAAVAFLSWKHGFVRADAHVLGFFTTVLVLSLALPPYAGSRRWSPLDVCPALCLLGLALCDPSPVPRLPLAVPERLAAGLGAALAPWRAAAALTDGEARARQAQRREDLQARVGRGTIDMHGYDQSLLLMNGLEYRPRPVFQGFSAYTPELMRLNRDFLRSPRAPEFVLARLQTIDGRFPTQDDALALAELRLGYEVVHATLEDALLRRRVTPGEELARTPILERVVALGEEVELPRERGAALWLQVEARPTVRGRLRTLATSEARLDLVLTDEDGVSRSHRLIPAIAAEGFIVQPVIADQLALNAFLRGAGLSWARSVRLEASRRSRGDWSTFTVRVSRLPGLPVERSDLGAALVALGIVNVAPAEVRSEVRTEVLVEDGRPVVQVHAPGRVVVRPRGARRLTGVFGLRGGVVAPCDGAGFAVRVRRVDGQEEVVWSRHLDPLVVEADRGPQRLEVSLPGGDREVVLETTPGPAGDLRCDWSYWADLRFEP
ncbi:MAG: hypothetical protein M9894_02540 [Planctomycetes bacterium]|nr:hypothetical protein [Planctomycetota bacterium]